MNHIEVLSHPSKNSSKMWAMSPEDSHFNISARIGSVSQLNESQVHFLGAAISGGGTDNRAAHGYFASEPSYFTYFPGECVLLIWLCY